MMEHTNLVAAAHGLPDAWQSAALARIGNANIKIVRMDDSAREEETHAYDEVLVVLEGACTWRSRVGRLSYDSMTCASFLPARRMACWLGATAA